MSVANWSGKNATEKSLKNIYQDLQHDKIHQPFCNCAACLYCFLKAKNKKTRIDKDNFFLYWIVLYMSKIKKGEDPKFFEFNKDRDHNWLKALELYYKITGQKWRTTQFQEGEHFRIISRLDKKFNISQTILAKQLHEDTLPINISPLFMEIDKILNIVRLVINDSDLPSAYSIPDECFEEICKIWKEVALSAIKIVSYLSKEKKQLKHRDISMRFHINRYDLWFSLGYLEQNKIIIWDKKEKKVSLDPDWLFWFNRFLKSLYSITKDIKQLAPFSITDAIVSFHKQTERTLMHYDQIMTMPRIIDHNHS